MLTLVILIVTLIGLIVKLNSNRRRLVRYVSEFKGPAGFPLVGNAFSFIGNPTDSFNTFMKFEREYGNAYRIWLFNTPYIVISNPDDIQLILNKNLEKDKSYSFLSDFLGDGLVTANLTKWKRHRRIINPAFNVTTLAEYFLESFHQENEKLVKRLSVVANTGEEFNIGEYTEFCSFSTLCRTAMGYEENEELSFTKIRQKHLMAFSLVGKRFYRPWLRPHFIFKTYVYTKGQSKIFEEIKELPKKIVEEKRKNFNLSKTVSHDYAEEEGKTPHNFVDILLNLSDNSDSFSNQEFIDEVLTLMFAGTESVATTVNFTLLMLAMRPDIQEKVYQEIKNVSPHSDQPLTATELYGLHYMEQCIKETLRRFHIFPLLLRRTDEDITLKSGQIIPAGASVNLLLASVHLNEKFYPQPYNWNPDNFQPDAVASRHPFTFLAFAGGPRICVGYKYAILAAKAMLASILRTYNVSTRLSMKDLTLEVSIMFRNIHGYPVTLRRRS